MTLAAAATAEGGGGGREADTNIDTDWGTPHAFHFNLPPNHFDDDGVPHITKFAHKKARMIVDLALSIKLTEEMFAASSATSNDIMDVDEEDGSYSDGSEETLVRENGKDEPSVRQS